MFDKFNVHISTAAFLYIFIEAVLPLGMLHETCYLFISLLGKGEWRHCIGYGLMTLFSTKPMDFDFEFAVTCNYNQITCNFKHF